MGHVRATQSVQAPSGTGINRWWRYQEENIPGGGHVMVNVGTGNVLIEDEDMSLSHKGMSLTFRRMYNSQSLHDMTGSDGSTPSLYGNGWTNTFDAHMIRQSPSIRSVYDIDGARYDYTVPSNPTWASGMILHAATPGNHDYVQYDGQCGWFWIKKTGTIYYFYLTEPGTNCPAMGTLGAYSGRLYQIVGRNQYTNLTFTYSWDNGDASLATGKVRSISVRAESGMTATLNFDDVAGHRLLGGLWFPDGLTYVAYGYDTQGNLVNVSRPPHTASGERVFHGYGYAQQANGGPIIGWADSPRWAAGGPDGGVTAFAFTGNTPATATLNAMARFGTVNPTISDGTNSGPLQAGHPTTLYEYYDEFYATGVPSATFRDTDGHATNWVIDSQGRPTQTQECTVVVNQACNPGAYLITNESWDVYNNLVSEVDARGAETDYAYDVDGNTVAVAAPAPAPGAFRPTSLYTYGAYDNLVAYCDPVATHALQADWTSPPAGPISVGGGPCPTQNTAATQYQWIYPWYEPFGELASSTSPATSAAPNGYQTNYAYDPGPQGGIDYGLPTAVTGASLPQNDASTPIRQPKQSFWYDANGNLLCYGTGAGQWLLAYDVLGRVTSTSDPDDSSAGTGVCGKTGAQPNWNTTTRMTYFPDGSLASKQSASQAANGVGTSFTYDADGNVTTETHHYGCVTVSGCTAGVTQKFYDGADRLVEVLQPWDGWDVQSYPWATRYIYDLSAGGTTPYRGAGLAGHGNLVSTQELLSGTVWQPNLQTTYGIATGTWTDVRATAFDALDRAVTSYEAAFGDQPKERRSYDAAGEAGLLASATLATSEVKHYTYDDMGRQTGIDYSGGPNVTPGVHFTFDADNRVLTSNTDILGTETMRYDAAGNLLSVVEPASIGGGTISYDYYGDGKRKDVNYAGGGASYIPLLQYSYRNDGRPERLQLNNGAAFGWTYTAAGREQSQSDPLTGTTIHPDATHPAAGNHEAVYYPASMTYVPRTLAYDTYGRLSHLGLPEALQSSMSYDYAPSQYDLEDSPVAETRNRYSQSDLGVGSNVAVQACLPTTIRNEKMPVPGNPNCSSLVPTHQTYNGTLMTDVKAYDPSSTPGWLLDARAGMLLNDHYTSPRSGNIINAAYVHDASGRLTQDSEAKEPPCPAGDPYAGPTQNPYCYSNGTRQKSYDAENRLRSDVYSWANPNTSVTTPYGVYLAGGYWAQSYQPANIQTVDYNAASHPARLALYHPDYGGAPSANEMRAWLWDGNERFLTCQLVNSQCTAPNFSLEGLGDYDPASGSLSVNDRNRAGLVVTSHSATAFRDWTDSMGSAFIVRSGGANDPCSMDAAYCTSQHDGKLTADGWTLDNDTWQGVRTYDGTVGQWNSPDAYAGDIHDPMSQKPYMWNGNNPYAYSDPSGYAIVPSDAPVSCDFMCRIGRFVDELRVGTSPVTTSQKFRDEYGRVFDKAYKSIRDHLKIDDLKGAVIQARTGRRTLGVDGKPYDHVHEVQDAVNSINNGLRKAAELSKQSWLNQADRDAIKAAESYLNQAKTELQQILTRDGAANAFKW